MFMPAPRGAIPVQLGRGVAPQRPSGRRKFHFALLRSAAAHFCACRGDIQQHQTQRHHQEDWHAPSPTKGGRLPAGRCFHAGILSLKSDG